jgi:hypothetical protein
MDARAAEILAMGKKVGATRDKIALLCVNEVNEARKKYVWRSFYWRVLGALALRNWFLASSCSPF